MFIKSLYQYYNDCPELSSMPIGITNNVAMAGTCIIGKDGRLVDFQWAPKMADPSTGKEMTVTMDHVPCAAPAYNAGKPNLLYGCPKHFFGIPSLGEKSDKYNKSFVSRCGDIAKIAAEIKVPDASDFKAVEEFYRLGEDAKALDELRSRVLDEYDAYCEKCLDKIKRESKGEQPVSFDEYIYDLKNSITFKIHGENECIVQKAVHEPVFERLYFDLNSTEPGEESASSDNFGFDMITGEYGKLARTFPKYGQASLISFQDTNLCSYGRKKLSNCPMLPATAYKISEAFKHLMHTDRNHFNVGGDEHLIFWTTGTGGDDELDELQALLGTGHGDNDGNLKKHIESPVTGIPGTTDLDGEYYVASLLVPKNGRITLRAFHHGPLRELHDNIEHYKYCFKTYNAFDKANPGICTANRIVCTGQRPGAKDDNPLTINQRRSMLMNAAFGGHLDASIFNGIVERVFKEASFDKSFGKGKKSDRHSRVTALAGYLKWNGADVPEDGYDGFSSNVPYLLGVLYGLHDRIARESKGNAQAKPDDCRKFMLDEFRSGMFGQSTEPLLEVLRTNSRILAMKIQNKNVGVKTDKSGRVIDGSWGYRERLVGKDKNIEHWQTVSENGHEYKRHWFAVGHLKGKIDFLMDRIHDLEKEQGKKSWGLDEKAMFLVGMYAGDYMPSVKTQEAADGEQPEQRNS